MHISELWIYPLKSIRGISQCESRVMSRGLAWDRHWMLVDSAGEFISGRQCPQLVRVEARISTAKLRLSAADRPDLEIPLELPPGPKRRVRIWRDEYPGRVASGAASTWFSEYLQRECWLIQLSETHRRRIDPDYGEAEDEVSFADGFPLLAISAGSLGDLNSRLARPVSMRRFRPNLVIAGTEPFAEDGWRRIQVGEVVLKVVKPCTRCVFTTVDPDTGERGEDREPLRTLAAYRRHASGGVMFGQNLIPESTGIVRVGDAVTVLA